MNAPDRSILDLEAVASPLRQALALAEVLGSSDTCEPSAQTVAASIEALIGEACAALHRMSGTAAQPARLQLQPAAAGRGQAEASEGPSPYLQAEALHSGLVLARDAVSSCSADTRQHGAWLLDGLATLARRHAHDLATLDTAPPTAAPPHHAEASR